MEQRVLVFLGLALACSLSSGLWTVFGAIEVTHLPGFNGRLPFHMETGYVTVDEFDELNLFYYFFKSERNPAEDPLLLWHAGGPGCSGFTALALEIGPFGIDFDSYHSGGSLGLTSKEESWTKNSNIIFLDWLAGTGFSYSKGAEENGWSDSKSTKHIYTFIRKWLLDHPEFISNPFYVSGDSFGGKIVPIVTQEIINGNEAQAEPHVNLKGYLIGNPRTGDLQYDDGTMFEFSHGMGLISEELYEVTKASCRGDYVTPRNVRCAKSLEAVHKNLESVNKAHILEPNCNDSSPNPEHSNREFRSLSDIERAPSLQNNIERCRSSDYVLLELWANNHAVQEALGVSEGWKGHWERCRELSPRYIYDIPSNIPYHLNITSKGYRALVYSGDHDLGVNFVGTRQWIRTLNYTIVDDWRPWWFNGQVAGYTRAYANNLTYATIKGAGHTAPEFKPKQSFAMFGRWLLKQAI